MQLNKVLKLPYYPLLCNVYMYIYTYSKSNFQKSIFLTKKRTSIEPRLRESPSLGSLPGVGSPTSVIDEFNSKLQNLDAQTTHTLQILEHHEFTIVDPVSRSESKRPTRSISRLSSNPQPPQAHHQPCCMPSSIQAKRTMRANPML